MGRGEPDAVSQLLTYQLRERQVVNPCFDPFKRRHFVLQLRSYDPTFFQSFGHVSADLFQARSATWRTDVFKPWDYFAIFRDAFRHLSEHLSPLRLLACPLQLLHSSRHGIARIRSLLPDLEGSALLTTFNVKVSSSSVSAKSIALFTGVIDVIDQTSKSLCYFVRRADFQMEGFSPLERNRSVREDRALTPAQLYFNNNTKPPYLKRS